MVRHSHHPERSRWNELFKERLQEVKQLVEEGKPTVPSTIGEEKQTNIFLRAKTPDKFAHLRKLKDSFG